MNDEGPGKKKGSGDNKSDPELDLAGRELQLLFQSSPDILAIAGPEGFFTNVNPAFCRLTGYSEEELTSRPIMDFIHPDDRVATVKEYNVNRTGESPADNFVNRYRTRSGEFRWISWSSSPVFGKTGSFIAFGRDITHEKNLQNLLDNATQMARVGGWEMDLINRFIHWSPMTREIHEVAPDFNPDIETEFKFYREDVREEVKRRVIESMDSHQPFDFEMPIITARGNERWVRVIGNIEVSDGEAVRLYGSFQDIQDQKMAEFDRQKALEDKYRILERIGDAFFAVGRDWTVTYWNKIAEEILLKPREKILGYNLWEVYEDAKGLEFYTQYHKAVREQVTVHFEEFYPALEKWFEVSAYPSETGLSVFFRDISYRKKQEKKLLKTLKEREILLSEVHHRVKNNLAVVSAMMQLQAYETDEEEVRDLLFNSVNRIKTMANIHEHLYMSESFSDLEFSESLQRLVPAILESIPAGDRITLNFRCSPVRLNINQAIPCSLITNEVVTNIIKHAFREQKLREIRIELEERDGEVFMAIQDNGIGLPPDFETQAERTLGLRLIELLSQQINANCQFESWGSGTRFTLTFAQADIRGSGGNS